MTHRFVLMATLLASLCSGDAALQASEREDPSSDWTNLARVAPGQRVEVIDMGLKRTQGEFRGSSTDGLQIATSSGSGSAVTTIPRSEVFRVSLTGKPKRLRNAMIGLAVGAAAGLVTGALLDRSFSEDNENIAKAVFVPAGIGAGAALGAAFPGFETVYRAKRRDAGAAAGTRKP